MEINEIIRIIINALAENLNAIIAVATLVILYFTYKTTVDINRKEYEINEDLKDILLQIIAALRSIDMKAATACEIKKYPESVRKDFKINYNPEIKKIKQLQLSPGHLVFLDKIEKEEYRIKIIHAFAFLTEKTPFLPDEQDIMGLTYLVLEGIKASINKKMIKNKKTLKQMKRLCELDAKLFYKFDYKKWKSMLNYHAIFISYLNNKGIKDSELNTYFVNKLLEKYNTEFDEFLKEYSIR